MSVHSTYYDDPEEYERDLKWEYRKEQWEQDHGIVDDLPFYTDDPDDPHWKCENCRHCKEFKMFRRIVGQHPQYYFKGNNPTRYEDHKFYTLWVKPDYSEMESIWMCEVDHREHMDDDCCEEFIEVEE